MSGYGPEEEGGAKGEVDEAKWRTEKESDETAKDMANFGLAIA